MTAARIAKELLLEVPNKVGMLAEVTAKVAEEGVNVEALNAYVIENKAYFRLVVSDVGKAKAALSEFAVKEGEVVIVELENKVGAAKAIGSKLKKANIDLSYVYGSTCNCVAGSCDCNCLFVFSSNNNKKAVEIL